MIATTSNKSITGHDFSAVEQAKPKLLEILCSTYVLARDVTFAAGQGDIIEVEQPRPGVGVSWRGRTGVSVAGPPRACPGPMYYSTSSTAFIFKLQVLSGVLLSAHWTEMRTLIV